MSTRFEDSPRAKAGVCGEPTSEYGPTLKMFGTPGTVPDANTDVMIAVSLNGKLIAVERSGSGEELYGINWHEVDNLVGRILTLVDATFADPVQRKAFKDMVRQHVKEWMTGIMVAAGADAGVQRNLMTEFVGGVLDQDGGLFGVEGEPTP